MPAINTISHEKLVRLIGTPKCPTIIDVRQFNDEHLVPCAISRAAETVAQWCHSFSGENVIVVCEDGAKHSPGVAAWLRYAGIEAEILEGGVNAWQSMKLAMVPEKRLPARDAHGRTVWVTRARPKVDRVACPWLIRRFVDPRAVFLYVAPTDVQSVAQQYNAAPFDIEGPGVIWSHRDELCTFDVMVDALGLAPFDALKRLAVMVRGADTGHLELAPEAAGLLAASLGLSRMYADDLEQLEAGMTLYDSLYRWCRDATDETHNWVSHRPPKRQR